MLTSISYIRLFIIFFLLYFSNYSLAQYDDEYPVPDTVVEAYPDKMIFRFNEKDTSTFKIDERKVPDSTLAIYKNSEDFWYASFEPKKPKKVDEGSSGTSDGSFLRSLLWFVIAGSFVLIIIWFLASSTSLFRKKPEKIWEENEEDLHQDIFAINYENEIHKAKAAKNYRLAIRLFYLQLLKTLSDKGTINYKQEKTNSDYLMQLFGSNYYNNFFKLTRNFEYAWYGHFPVSEDAFEGIEKDFKEFKKSLPS